MTLIRDLLSLPTSVRKGDFVLSLNRGIVDAQETVDSYAITPNLLQAFKTVLSVIDSALRSGRSQAVYLHGSFGSGKSHFMAVLDLMLAGHPAPWERKELHKLREENPWVEDSKLLQLPLHMVGARSMEEKIFGAYVKHVQEHHPDAPIPAVYADQQLFDNARVQRENMGDEKFFEVLNRAAPKVDARWGKRAQMAQWTSERLEQAVASSDPKQRAELFSALVKTHFPAFASQTQAFIDLDRGLGVISRHASDLGYKAIVLYLDELILWLAGHFADLSWVQNEAQKIAKLKEAQDEQRDVPIISFIARQRDLSEMVGDDAVGAERLTLRDSIEFHSGRLETVSLADSNLQAIVSHRVVRPRDATASETIKDGFVEMQRSASSSWAALLGSFGDEAGFKQVYPFSPALIEVLVALSECLQRERTAIRILMELLVEHLTDLELGQVVPVGEIYDVIAGGGDALDGVMRERFERARHLYRHKLLPLIHAANDTGTRERCQRLRDDHPASLGCSGCLQIACRNDNRLAKTLLLAALVPNAPPFKELTVRRLVHLNHGTVRSPIQGKEVQIAADKLRKWATQVGQLRMGDEGDPRVFLRLEGVDLQPILEAAQEVNTPGSWKRMLQQILFAALELPANKGADIEEIVVWEGTRRKGTVRFGNVRSMADGHLRCPEASEWYVVVDYPFDDPGHTPEDDLQRLREFLRDQAGDNYTVVWLPTFFTDKMVRELGELCVVDHILTGDNPRTYLAYLRPEDQARARQDLESLLKEKHKHINRALAQAYGIGGSRDDGMLDPSRAVEEHLLSLQPGLEVRPLAAGSFRHGLVQICESLLGKRYPHHKGFESPVTPGKLEKVRKHLEQLLELPDNRTYITAAEHKELRGFAVPLELAVLSETVAELKVARLKEVEQQRERAGVGTPTVSQVREYVDPEGRRGLVREAADLLVWIYAMWSGRSLELAGDPLNDVKLGRLPDDAELVKPDLPTQTEWQAALKLCGELFGLTLAGRALHARNLTELSHMLDDAVERSSSAVDLVSALRTRLDQKWAGDEAIPPRLITAQSGADLLALLGYRQPRRVLAADRVRRLAGFEPLTSGPALSESLLSARDVTAALRRDAEWLVFTTVRSFLGDATRKARAEALLADLAQSLRADQVNVKLVPKLGELVRRAQELIGAGLPPTTTVDRSVSSDQVGQVSEEYGLGRSRESVKSAIKELAARLEERAVGLLEGVDEGELRLKLQALFLHRKDEGGE